MSTAMFAKLEELKQLVHKQKYAQDTQDLVHASKLAELNKAIQSLEKTNSFLLERKQITEHMREVAEKSSAENALQISVALTDVRKYRDFVAHMSKQLILFPKDMKYLREIEDQLIKRLNEGEFYDGD